MNEYKVSIPLITNEELETFDSNIHNIVEEYSKMYFKEKDQILTQRLIMKQEEEIERLHSIIKEVREYIEDLYDVRFTDKDKRKILEILDKEGK